MPKKKRIPWNKGKKCPWAQNNPQVFKKGHIPWSKGKKGICLNTGRTHFKKGQSFEWRTTIEWRKKLKEKALKRIKENRHNFWKGGITKENKIIRESLDFRLWREAVFARDNWTCWICEKRGDKLHPHHIKKFSDYPKLRFDISNGLTLCEFCHRTYTNFGNQYNKIVKK